MPKPRPLAEVIAHIRAVANDPRIDTTLIQTQDLCALCDAAEQSDRRRAALDEIIVSGVGDDCRKIALEALGDAAR